MHIFDISSPLTPPSVSVKEFDGLHFEKSKSVSNNGVMIEIFPSDNTLPALPCDLNESEQEARVVLAKHWS